MRAPARRSTLPLLAAAALLAACAGDDTSAELALRTEVDTLGDTVVVRTLGPADAGLLQLVEEVRIGELEGEEAYTFGGINEVVALPNGNVLAFDYQAVALREYGSDGRLVRTFGRRGAGPGEYEAANGITILPDGRIALWDPRNTRIQLWKRDGTPDGMIRVESGLFTSRALGSDPEGRLYYSVVLRDEGERRFNGLRIAVVRTTLDGTRRDTLPPPVEPPEGSLLSATSPDGGMRAAYNVPFLGGPTWALHHGGGYAFTTDDRYRIRVERPDDPMVIERDIPPVPVASAERENHEAVVTANMRRTDPGWSWNGPAIPATKQFVHSISSDADGRLWVRTSMPGMVDSTLLADRRSDEDGPARIWTEPAAFDVFGTDGRFLGRVVFPERSGQLHSAAGDHLWGVQRDELGVEQLVRWRITPSISGEAPPAP